MVGEGKAVGLRGLGTMRPWLLAAGGLALVGASVAGWKRWRSEPPPPPVEAPQDEEDDEPPPWPIADPSREVTLGPADLTTLPTVELDFPAKAPSFVRRPAGRGKVIFEAPHLEFYGRGPVGKDRIIVRVKSDADWRAPTLRAHLLDLEAGPIAEVKSPWPMQVPKFGFSKATAVVDGEEQEVLLHSEDGLIVPVYQGLDRARMEVYINPGRNDGWVFEFDRNNPVGPGRYAHWTDLRKPPPLPSQPLPFVPIEGTFVPTRASGKSTFPFAGPTDHLVSLRVPHSERPAPINAVVHSEEIYTPCLGQIELLPDGGYRCAGIGVQLAGGWNLAEDLLGRGAAAFNLDTKEVQYLELDEYCDGFRPNWSDTEGLCLDPPRALFYCSKLKAELLWSPEGLQIVPELDPTADSDATRKGQLATRAHSFDGMYYVFEWLDLVHRRRILTPYARHSSPYTRGRTTLVRPATRPREMWAIDFDEVETLRIAKTDCADMGVESGDGSFWIVTCVDRRDRVRWSEAVEIESRSRWRLPATVGVWNRRVWVEPEGRKAVAILRRGGKDRVHVWDLVP